MEIYNSCISPEANERAAVLAEKYHLPGTGGSDAHKIDCVGLAFTDFAQPIRTESDLINYLSADCNADSATDTVCNPNAIPAFDSARITPLRTFISAVQRSDKASVLKAADNPAAGSDGIPILTCGGSHYPGTTRDHLGMAYDLLLKLYYVYSKAGNFFKRSKLEAEVVYLLSVSDTLFHRIRSMDFLNMLPEKAQKKRQWKEIEDELYVKDMQQ